MNESRSSGQHQALGFWLWEELVSVALMIAAFAALFLMPKPLQIIPEVALSVSVVASSVGGVVTSVDTIRNDPVKRRRAKRIWHTVGARIFVGGFIAFVAGACIAGAGIAVTEWTRSLAALNLLGTPATIVMGLGVAALFTGLVAYIIEDAVRDSRWPDGSPE